jgi:hypothetical protein
MRLPGGSVSHSHSVANLAQTHVFECPSGKKSALNSTCYDRDFTIPSNTGRSYAVDRVFFNALGG